MGFLGQLFTMAISAILIQNFVLSRFLGLCPYLGVSKKMDSAFGMGMAVIFVMTLASAFCYLIYQYILVPFELEYLQTLAFILTIAALVQFVEMFIKKNSPALYKSLGVYLPLITTNCAVLGVAILNITPLADGTRYNFIWAVLNGFLSGVGFTFVLLAMAGIRERLEMVEMPKSMRGMPSGLILAGTMALAFYGFMGMKF
ncbi:electron transport complex protein RnfA [Candidatus Cloacimonas acidaminovorans]|jgi:electron transport complex protein RnfA|uniref:Ion-translocating oxidoreductase complex subunit A n=1 Tax=Cloacimonas acidaminovorans (strain Evry) TaxID=459349 RepID=B0VFN6_CLOAI|nr:RnfABCDGE type electron transport complex subunit A [Candidatus Cloacimonas acidaminovorans]MBP8704988.1 RnfABCDGE type electron transport complex subunit A [Candidatus Cloacimonas sp.]NLM90928.1 RnfABCDGE type electron transport complex subunit A [Candidatus Cloacimonadota bacterium]CAO81374.1 electron transport complex protein rnfA [Candidatus Cloacimonas acidaminovorans str. Evry]HNZ88369.1 RnfABCDGE type electron transport complex subunit A [Candidatus Cloacimonas acidaminovorans]HOI020